MTTGNQSWAFEHSIVCAVHPEFAWRFWTTVGNWALDGDVESVELEGPFAAGTRGITMSKSSGRIDWRIAELRAGEAVIEFPLPRAVGRFRWVFEAVAEGTRITQRCTIEGEEAGTYAQSVGPALEAGVPDGMQKLCTSMVEAARRPAAT